MTEIQKLVLEEYQVRKTKRQKTAFIELLNGFTEENNYKFKVEKGLFGSRNLVVGDVDTAKVVYTAHYDTCPHLPFPNFITPKNFFIYLLYQIAILIPIFVIIFSAAFLLGLIAGVIGVLLNISADTVTAIALGFYYLLAIGFMALLLFGPANKNTANDNTSGVTTLLNIMCNLPESERDRVAFVFFDLEEVGVIGSSLFASKHKKAMKNKLLVNFDCVSDGEHMLFALKKKARAYSEAFKEAFKDNEHIKTEVATKGVFYPSDQMNFKFGVGVASLKKSKRFSVLYMDKIHTKHDTVYREENIDFLTDGAIKLLSII